MSLFKKRTSVEIIQRIIRLAKECLMELNEFQTHRSLRKTVKLLRWILKLDKESLIIVEQETGSKQLRRDCERIISLISEAMQKIEKSHNLEKARSILKEIIILETRMLSIDKKILRQKKIQEKSLDSFKKELLDFYKLPRYSEARTTLENLSSDQYHDLFNFYRKHHIYQILNEEFVISLALILNFLHRKTDHKRPILEIAAGDGKLSYHLRRKGVYIIPTDDYSWSIKPGFYVRKLSHTKALQRFNPDIVLVSWIPYESDMGVEVMRYPSVRFMVCIGEGYGGSTGSEAQYKVADYRVIKPVSKYALCRSDYKDILHTSIVEVFYKK